MRLKLSLKQQGMAVRDVQVTADVTATIGDIARYLVEADPARPARVGGEVTLRVEFPGRGQARLLNPLLSVHESVLRSGCTVEVVSPSAPRSGDDLYGRPVALVQVISGPGEGAEFTVASGVNYIGRDPAAQVVLTDDQVSRRHASITIAESITNSDLNSANGVEVDGVLVSRAILTRASRVRIGDSVLRLAQLSEARVRTSHRAPELAVTVEGGDEPDPSAFARSPRVEAAYRGTATPVPELPGIPEKARFPMLAVIAPVVMGAVLFIVTKQIYSLIFIALSPVIMLGTWIENRSQNKRKSRDEIARFADSLEATRESLLAEREREIAARIAESPSLVTDLNTHLVRRALTSLRAELRYREHLLNSKGAKDLEALEKRSDPDAPPALVIVIDEFAALASEVPEFVDGMIDIAQRGRSLGLHLVMATQRPAGVIKDSLRANTNLRVSLRVADEADSLDVLGVNSAAFFDPGTPGRAAAKLGPGRVLDFQAAYLGGRTGPEGQPTTDVEVAYLEFGRGAGWVSPKVAGARQEGLARDIDRLSGTISSAARRRMLTIPRKPWQDQLATIHDLRDLAQPSSDVLQIGGGG